MCIWQTFPATEPASALRRQRGLSLVELMVAVVIGLFTVLAVVQTMSFFEAQRKGTTMGTDAQSGAAFAAYLIERDLRMGGYGLFSDENQLIERCTGGTVLAYNSARIPQDIVFAPANVPFAPVAINPPGIPAGDPNSDVIGIAYGDSSLGITGKGAQIGVDSGGGFSLGNTGGFITGDLMLAVPNVGAAANTPCRIHEITDGPGSVNCSGAGTSNVLAYAITDYNSRYHSCASITPTHNKPGGFGVAAAAYADGRMFNLGRKEGFTFAYYAVRNGQLTRCNHGISDCANGSSTADTTVWIPVVEDVVMLRAEFGLSSGGLAGAVDTWRPSVCAGGGCTPSLVDWQSLRVARFAVVSRSDQRASEDVTASQPNWNGQTAIQLTGDWQKFRYATIEVVVPLRNIVWGTSS